MRRLVLSKSKGVDLVTRFLVVGEATTASSVCFSCGPYDAVVMCAVCCSPRALSPRPHANSKHSRITEVFHKDMFPRFPFRPFLLQPSYLDLADPRTLPQNIVLSEQSGIIQFPRHSQARTKSKVKIVFRNEHVKCAPDHTTTLTQNNDLRPVQGIERNLRYKVIYILLRLLAALQ